MLLRDPMTGHLYKDEFIGHRPFESVVTYQQPLSFRRSRHNQIDSCLQLRNSSGGIVRGRKKKSKKKDTAPNAMLDKL
jgi:hypothetical protein